MRKQTMRKCFMTSWRGLLAMWLMLALPLMIASQSKQSASYDVIIKAGTVYDGTGRAPVRADIGIRGDRITLIGNLKSAAAPVVIDASGLAVAPGFINMLSHSESSL